jgi:hypothetical protein
MTYGHFHTNLTQPNLTYRSVSNELHIKVEISKKLKLSLCF